MLKRNEIRKAVLMALAGSTATSGVALAEIEEVIVTATKREASTQDIPVAVQALGGEALRDLGVSNFDDYVQYLPNVEQGGRGPGQTEIFVRGAATETSPNEVSSVQGSAPSVALYQDEQPVSFGGRNLDIYAADLNRIEVLAGPQGTLFGASSQSGTVRLITNKPVQQEFQAGVSADYSSTSGGDESAALEGYFNLPLADQLAFRAVVYSDSQGGWIDNVPGAYTLDPEVVNRNQISAAATVCTGAATDPAACAGRATISTIDNSKLVESNFNDALYRGARFGLAYDINDNWDILVQHTRQTLETEGAFDYDPNLNGEDKVQRYVPIENTDEFGLTTWTLNGRIANLDMVYTGGFLSRDVFSITDYTGYTNGGGYQAYYLCTGGYSNATQCFSPRKQYKESTKNRRQTHEFRVSTDESKRFRFTGGLFLDEAETNSEGEFQYDGAIEAGFDVASSPGSSFFPVRGVNNPNGRGANTIFVNDFTRETEQIAFFGELSFDITEQISLSIGARNYDIDFTLAGSTGSSFACKGVDPATIAANDARKDAILRPNGTLGCDGEAFDNNVSSRLAALGNGSAAALDGRFGAGAVDTTRAVNNGADIAADIASGSLFVGGLGADGVANQSDTIIRAALDWRINEDILLFTTFAEGFRPQVTNRNASVASGNQTGPFANYRVPAVAVTDELENFELGIKGDFFDNTLRVNATYYSSDITNLQVNRFDPANVAFLVFIENVGDAEIDGLDLDFQWAPTDSLSFTGSLGLLDSELTRVNPQLVGVAVPVGSELPYSASVSGNIRGRYDFALPNSGADGYFQLGVVYKGEAAAGLVGNAFQAEDTMAQVFGANSGLQIETLAGSNGGPLNQADINAVTNPAFLTSANGQTFYKSGRYIHDSYSFVNMSLGYIKDNWTAELYIDNLADKSADIFIHTQDFVPRVTTNRPRTIGLRLGYDF